MQVCQHYFVTRTGTGNVPMVDRGGNPIDSGVARIYNEITQSR